ncbi:MAG: hypothetical protein JO320_07880 [Alphaproteobacteria bacterium]|nr:hypothetical protein [Alphaproteobacteria bacterium]
MANDDEEPAKDEADVDRSTGQLESDEGDGDNESDTDRRRRRRGRRGGRRRGRRDGGTEGGFEEPRPAVDTVEVLPTPQLVQDEPIPVQARPSWPEELGIVAIETASLPALAGDVPANTGGSGAVGTGPEEPANSQISHPERTKEAADTADSSASAPTAEAEQGVPYAAETERELEPASAELDRQHKPEPPDPVETVTEKPANPRRGWWQRLIQS